MGELLSLVNIRIILIGHCSPDAARADGPPTARRGPTASPWPLVMLVMLVMTGTTGTTGTMATLATLATKQPKRRMAKREKGRPVVRSRAG